MQKDLQVAALEGGALRVVAFGKPGREAVLALPLNRLLAKVVRVPPGEDPVAAASPVLQAMSPFPDEPLTVSCETVAEAADGSKAVLAAALPESSADDLGELLDAKKLSVTRIDVLELGQLRDVWERFDADDGRRRLVRVRSDDGVALVVLDGGTPVALRGVAGDEPDRERVEMLLLLEAEAFAGPRPSAGTVEVERTDAAIEGVAERSEDPGALNALPASWQEVLEETRFKAKLVRRLAAAVAVWALAMGVLFGVPVAYGFMTDHQKTLSKQHARQYRQVSDKKKKVDVFKAYSDHDRGALEIMKTVSDRLPQGVTLLSWSYDRQTGLRISGEADTTKDVYDFKNKMEELKFVVTDEDGNEIDDPNAERVFATVELGRLNLSKGLQRFDMDLGFVTPEEDSE